MYPQVYTSRVDRRRAKTNVHTLVVNPSMILTSTLVPGVHWMIRFNSVSFRDSRPSFQSMVHGRYGHTTGYDPFRRYGLMIMSIGNLIKDTPRRGYQSSMGVFGDPPGPYAALIKIRINPISPHLDNNMQHLMERYYPWTIPEDVLHYTESPNNIYFS